MKPIKASVIGEAFKPGGFKSFFANLKNTMQIKLGQVIISAPNMMMISAAFKSNNIWAILVLLQFIIEVSR